MDLRKLKSSSSILSLLKMGCIISFSDNPNATCLKKSSWGSVLIVQEHPYRGQQEFSLDKEGVEQAIEHVLNKMFVM